MDHRRGGSLWLKHAVVWFLTRIGKSLRALSEENGAERTCQLDHYLAILSVIILLGSGIEGEELIHKYAKRKSRHSSVGLGDWAIARPQSHKVPQGLMVLGCESQ